MTGFCRLMCHSRSLPGQSVAGADSASEVLRTVHEPVCLDGEKKRNIMLK